MSSSTLARKRYPTPDVVLPGLAHARSGFKSLKIGGVEAPVQSVDLRSLGILPGMVGGSRGTHTEGDILTALSDGTDLNELWSTYQSVVQEQNAARQVFIDLLTFDINEMVEEVSQVSGDDFELASEFGVPKSIRLPGGTIFSMGFSFDWYDLASRYTWRFLLDAPRSQVDAVANAALEADNRLVFTKVMQTVYNPSNLSTDIRGQAVPVYKFYNGDGTVPPPWKTFTHTSTHSHYLTSLSATVDAGDLDQMYQHIRHHGYGTVESGTKVVLAVNQQEGRIISQFRLGVNGSLYDSVPPASAPPFFLPNTVQGIQGNQPPSTYEGLEVVCQWGPILVVQDDYFPPGYMFMFATGGSAALNNPVGFRQHPQRSVRGMQLIKGPQADYPLIDSYYIRGFGTGIRHRGAGVLMQVTTNATYAPPALYV